MKLHEARLHKQLASLAAPAPGTSQKKEKRTNYAGSENHSPH
jgi:hypothetical protein